jgi:hypothetical protein
VIDNPNETAFAMNGRVLPRQCKISNAHIGRFAATDDHTAFVERDAPRSFQRSDFQTDLYRQR